MTWIKDKGARELGIGRRNESRYVFDGIGPPPRRSRRHDWAAELTLSTAIPQGDWKWVDASGFRCRTSSLLSPPPVFLPQCLFLRLLREKLRGTSANQSRSSLREIARLSLLVAAVIYFQKLHDAAFADLILTTDVVAYFIFLKFAYILCSTLHSTFVIVFK